MRSQKDLDSMLRAADSKAKGSRAARPGGLRAAWTHLRSSTWLRPVAKASMTFSVVAALSWFGARSMGPLPLAFPAEPASSGVMAAFIVASSVEVPREPAPDDGGQKEAAADAGVGSAVLTDGRVVLNLAETEELCRLPGIGPSRAKQILSLRQKLGKFRSYNELRRVKGIGARTLTKIKERSVLDAP